MTTVLGAFNNHLMEFIEDIEQIFPDDRDIKAAKTALEMIKKTNPRVILLLWRSNITIPYSEQIENSDISFFLEKDYTDDVQGSGHEKRILQAVDRLRKPVSNMGEENQAKAMKYIQNLSKLSSMYQ